MEITWRQRYLAAYQHEADCARALFVGGERDPDFLLHMLHLVRTYLAIPGDQRHCAAVDLAVARLAEAIHAPLHARGYWSEISTLWPVLGALARQHTVLHLYVELGKQAAITHDCQGESAAADQLYTQLIADPCFTQIPRALQVDVLHQFGTTLVRKGELRQAHLLLSQVLTQIAQLPVPSTERNRGDLYGIRGSFQETPLWECQAYTLNQLGNIALFRGEFALAERLYRECEAILLRHDEADNLCCVAYQALGRLWIYRHQPAKAVPFFVRALAIRRRWQEEEGSAFNLLYLAKAYLQMGLAERAAAQLMEVLPLLQRLGSRRDLALYHLYFGQLAWIQSRRPAAYSHWHQALDYLLHVHLPLIEQTPLLRYLHRLPFTGKRALLRRTVGQILRTVRQQQLTLFDLWRLYRNGIG